MGNEMSGVWVRGQGRRRLTVADMAFRVARVWNYAPG